MAAPDWPDPVNEPESEPAPEEKPGSGPGAFTFADSSRVITAMSARTGTAPLRWRRTGTPT